MKALRSARASLVAFTLAVGLTLGVIAVATGSSSDSADQAAAVAGQTDVQFAAGSQSLAGQGLRERASEVAKGIPLPAGGNFNGLRWEELGQASSEDIRFLLQFNAACQWLRAVADGRSGQGDQAVLQAIPGWPALRDDGRGKVFLQALTAAEGGTKDDASGLLAACRDSHNRETEYAASMGLVPSG